MKSVEIYDSTEVREKLLPLPTKLLSRTGTEKPHTEADEVHTVSEILRASHLEATASLEAGRTENHPR